MPVHSKEKKESHHEDMEVEYAEQEASSSEEEDTETSSVSEDGESSGNISPGPGLLLQFTPKHTILLLHPQRGSCLLPHHTFQKQKCLHLLYTPTSLYGNCFKYFSNGLLTSYLAYSSLAPPLFFLLLARTR